MKITVVTENESASDNITSEHGLSILIEANGKKVLMDTGASELFLKNAKELGVDIEDVDFLVLSHGHYDHGGGIEAFLKVNKKAKLYVNKRAFGNYFALRSNGTIEYIGLSKDINVDERFVLTEGKYEICEGFWTFSDVDLKWPVPVSNKNLFMEPDCGHSFDIDGSNSENAKCTGIELADLQNDTFKHEQSLVVEENGKSYLFGGCAHNGINNIIEHFKTISGVSPNVVIGGFHLSGKSKKIGDTAMIDEIADYLKSQETHYYTCHCTGVASYERLKNQMGEQIDYIKTGDEVVI